MILVLGVLGLSLLQEPVRAQEDARAKQRLQESEQHYRAGVLALQTERFEEAVEELRLAVRLDPNSFLAYFSLGKAYLSLRQFDDSVRAYLACREAWERSAADTSTLSTEREAQREDKIRELQDQLREVESQVPLVRSETDRSLLQMRIANFKVAISSLERLRGRDRDGVPEPPAEFALALGSAYLRGGSVDEAEKAYLEALRLRPRYGEALNNLAVICVKRGDFEQAYVRAKAAQKAASPSIPSS